jgi:acetoin:2,6-dichlorophenolindophenol oxidoreductase subunit alpha
VATTVKKTAKKTGRTAAKTTAANATGKRAAKKTAARKKTSRRKPAVPAGADALSEDTRLALYRQLVRIRRFEERAYRLFMDGLVKGTSHLSLGMEAIAAGVAEAMQEGDYTYATYRGHAHTLARGVPMDGVMAELLGRSNGVCGGKGGSMHLTSVEHGMMGSYAIIGAHLPIALGSAWASQLKGDDRVTVAFFGDGATNIGAFHEALNLAVVWNLPVVFVCENNLWMEYTPINSVTAVEYPAADRAPAYGLERIVVDGNDPEAVHLEAKKAIDKARSGGGPTMFEAMTYRHGGHSRADPGTYRPQEEVDEWLAKDPLPFYRKRLLELGVPETALEEIEEQAQGDVDAATETAKNGPLPDIDSAFTDVWADGGSSWRN